MVSHHENIQDLSFHPTLYFCGWDSDSSLCWLSATCWLLRYYRNRGGAGGKRRVIAVCALKFDTLLLKFDHI